MTAMLLCSGPRAASAYCRTRTCGERCTFDENGCAVEGEPIAWSNACVSYGVQKDGVPSISREELVQATDAAFRAWQEARCPSNAQPSISVYDLFGVVACRRAEYNGLAPNANIVMLRDAWEEDDGVLALTTVSYATASGEIYDADIEVNATLPITAGPLGPDLFDLQSILTHEAGHFLGLDHSSKGLADKCVGGATMCKTYPPGLDDFRTLDVDDVAAICAVYPPERNPPACDPTPRKGFSAECAMDPLRGGGCSLSICPSRVSNVATIAITVGCSLVAGRRRARARLQKRT